jgi:hypothetical protein
VRSQAGFALPVVLISLVGAMVLVAAATQTSALERLSSAALNQATAELLAVDGAVEQYLAALGPQEVAWTPPPDARLVTADGVEVRVSMARLAQWQTPDGSLVRVFAVAGRPDAGARSVIRLVRDSVPPADSTGPQVPVTVAARAAWFDVVR